MPFSGPKKQLCAKTCVSFKGIHHIFSHRRPHDLTCRAREVRPKRPMRGAWGHHSATSVSKVPRPPGPSGAWRAGGWQVGRRRSPEFERLTRFWGIFRKGHQDAKSSNLQAHLQVCLLSCPITQMAARHSPQDPRASVLADGICNFNAIFAATGYNPH